MLFLVWVGIVVGVACSPQALFFRHSHLELRLLRLLLNRLKVEGLLMWLCATPRAFSA